MSSHSTPYIDRWSPFPAERDRHGRSPRVLPTSDETPQMLDAVSPQHASRRTKDIQRRIDSALRLLSAAGAPLPPMAARPRIPICSRGGVSLVRDRTQFSLATELNSTQSRDRTQPNSIPRQTHRQLPRQLALANAETRCGCACRRGAPQRPFSPDFILRRCCCRSCGCVTTIRCGCQHPHHSPHGQMDNRQRLHGAERSQEKRRKGRRRRNPPPPSVDIAPCRRPLPCPARADA